MVRPATGRTLFPWAAWVWVAAWIAVILFLGGDRFSAAQTASWLTGLLPNLDLKHVSAIDAILRKTAHLVEYAVLGVLAYRAMRRSLRRGGRSVAAACAIVLALAVALIDEAGQSVSANRTGSLQDVLIDGSGSAAGALWSRRRRAPAPIAGP